MASQSLHTDAYDEVIATPGEETARIAIATQNILREEAGLVDVIDPLAGSYYVEALTDQMEAEIVTVNDHIDEAGGMFDAAESGVPHEMIGDSARSFAGRVETGEQTIVGVNSYQVDEHGTTAPAAFRPDIDEMSRFVADSPNSRPAGQSGRSTVPSKHWQRRQATPTTTCSVGSSTPHAPTRRTARSWLVCATNSASAGR